MISFLQQLFNNTGRYEPSGDTYSQRAPASLPDYVNLNGSLIDPQPFLARHAKIFNFVFQGDMNALQALCDRWFNNPSGNAVYYRPLVSDVVVSFVHYPEMRTLQHPYFEEGMDCYNEVGFSIIVAAIKKKAGVMVIEQYCVFIPYIFVSDYRAMAAGREIYGMPKALASISSAQAIQDSLSFHVEIRGIKEYNPDSRVSRHKLIDLKSIDTTGSDHSLERAIALWKDAGQAFKDIRKLILNDREITLPGLELLAELGRTITRHEVPLVSLKQFRDIYNGNKASYQAIIEFYFKLMQYRSGGILCQEFEMIIKHLDAFPIASDLGLKGEGQKARAAFWMDCDFVFENGKEVWRG